MRLWQGRSTKRLVSKAVEAEDTQTASGKLPAEEPVPASSARGGSALALKGVSLTNVELGGPDALQTVLARVAALELENAQLRDRRSATEALREDALAIVDAILTIDGGALDVCSLFCKCLQRAEVEQAKRSKAAEAENAHLRKRIAELEFAMRNATRSQRFGLRPPSI
jgi:hypothetical protein